MVARITQIGAAHSTAHYFERDGYYAMQRKASPTVRIQMAAEEPNAASCESERRTQAMRKQPMVVTM